MEDKALLEAIRAIVKEENKPINERLDTLQADVSDIKERLDSTERRVTEMGVIQENVTNPNITLIQEGLGRIEGKLTKHDKMESVLEEHDRRIWVLEHTVKAK